MPAGKPRGQSWGSAAVRQRPLVNRWTSVSGAGRMARWVRSRYGYGIGVGAAHQRRGYASEAVLLLLRFMFGERRYYKCEVHIYVYNVASLALHRSLGFVDEGRLRDHEFFAGRHHRRGGDGMTATEFAEPHPYDRL